MYTFMEATQQMANHPRPRPWCDDWGDIGDVKVVQRDYAATTMQDGTRTIRRQCHCRLSLQLH